MGRYSRNGNHIPRKRVRREPGVALSEPAWKAGLVSEFGYPIQIQLFDDRTNWGSRSSGKQLVVDDRQCVIDRERCHAGCPRHVMSDACDVDGHKGLAASGRGLKLDPIRMKKGVFDQRHAATFCSRAHAEAVIASSPSGRNPVRAMPPSTSKLHLA